MDLDDILNNVEFWLLGGGGIAAEIIGWKLSKSWTGVSFPFWQLLILMVGTLIAAAVFANKD